MGDNWEHSIIVEAVGPGDPDVSYPRFVAGARRCRPEDVCGIPGFEFFLEAIADPSHEEHDRLLEWYGRPYAPEDIDELATKDRVGRLPVRRAAGKAAHAERQTR